MTQTETSIIAPDLYVEYVPETDSLILSGVGSVLGSYGETVAHNLVAFLNEGGDEVRGVILYGAGKLLRPRLCNSCCSDQHSASSHKKVTNVSSTNEA